MPDLLNLLRDAYTCSRCPKVFGFSVSATGAYFKFPPIIGANETADLLFVGINPRRSDSNEELHQALMASKTVFKNLAANRINDGAYISTTSSERHYQDHLEIIRQVYGRPRTFESCAAVTELFLCASKNSQALPNPESPCAAVFLPRVMALIKPKVIIAVGSRVFAYFKTQHGYPVDHNEWMFCHDGRKIPVIPIPHPGNNKLMPPQRQHAIESAAAQIRAHLKA